MEKKIKFVPNLYGMGDDWENLQNDQLSVIKMDKLKKETIDDILHMDHFQKERVIVSDFVQVLPIECTDPICSLSLCLKNLKDYGEAEITFSKFLKLQKDLNPVGFTTKDFFISKGKKVEKYGYLLDFCETLVDISFELLEQYRLAKVVPSGSGVILSPQYILGGQPAGIYFEDTMQYRIEAVLIRWVD